MVDETQGYDPGDESIDDASEGVRIIGAEEAAEAIERGDVVSRRSEAEPKYGDRPARPPAGPRPSLRFPLDASEDPTQIERPPARPPELPVSKPVTGPVEMPHWTEPATGEVPKVVIGDADEADDLDAWSSFASATPRWRNEDDTEWDDAGFGDPSELAGEDTRIGALDTSDRPRDEELFSFDELDDVEEPEPVEPAPPEPAPRRSLFGRFTEHRDQQPEPEPEPEPAPVPEPEPVAEVEVEPFPIEETFEPSFTPTAQHEDEYLDPYADPVTFEEYEEPEQELFVPFGAGEPIPEPQEPVRQRISSRNVPGEPAAYGAGAEGGGGRNLGVAIPVGLGLVGIALVASAIGAFVLCLLVAVVLVLCAGEYFQAVRQAGYEPLALVGIVTVAAAPIAAYFRPEIGLYVVVVLGLVACLTTFVVGAGGQGRALDSVSVTVLGIVWIGLCGGFAGLMLAGPYGRQMVWAAILATVANDIGAYISGRLLGTRSFSEVSPGKTVEGVVGGGVITVIVTCLLVGTVPGLPPFDSLGKAFLLAIVVSVVAPLGDLCQSAVKRDLGLKDMGTLLPGHGGVFDRFDAMLLVLPAVFFLAYRI